MYSRLNSRNLSMKVFPDFGGEILQDLLVYSRDFILLRLETNTRIILEKSLLYFSFTRAKSHITLLTLLLIYSKLYL